MPATLVKFRHHPSGLMVLLLLLSLCAWAQEPGSPSQQPQQDPTAPQTQPQSDQPSDGVIPALKPNDQDFRMLGGAGLLERTPGQLRIGPLSLVSVEALQMVQNSKLGGVEDQLMGTFFSAHMVFDKKFLRSSRIALQYRPQVTVIDGEVRPDYAGHDASINLSFALTRRVTLNLSDQFSRYGAQNRFLEGAFQADPGSGYFNQADAIQRPGQYTSNQAHTSLGIMLSQRNQLQITPDFAYVYSKSSDLASNWGQSYGGRVRFRRLLSPRSEVGFFYGANENDFHRTLTDTLYQSAGMDYSQGIGRTWFVRVSAAASTTIIGGTRRWTPQPRLTVSKSFRNSSIALAYMRTSNLTGHLRRGYADQADLSYQAQLTRRLQLSLGGGHYVEILSPEDNSVRYGRVAVSCYLFANFELFATYMHRKQAGDPTVLALGTYDYVATGLRWSPGKHNKQ